MPTHINSQIAAARRLSWLATRMETSKAGAIKFLQGSGWKRIGSGAFGVAFANDLYPDTVIKVSAQPTARSNRTMDDGFPEYVNAIVRKWIRSSFAPRIYFTAPLEKNDRITVTAMERCYRCKDREFVNKAQRTATNLNSTRRIYDGYCLGGHARRFLEDLKQYGELDIHSGNVMQRHDGSLVFTDPLIIRL